MRGAASIRLGLLVASTALLGGCWLDHGSPESVDCTSLPTLSEVEHRAPPERACGSRGIGTGGLLADSPRANKNLEQAALVATEGFVAKQADYERLVRDVARIDELLPDRRSSTGPPRFQNPHHPALELEVTEQTARAIETGNYAAWDCLNEHYRSAGYMVERDVRALSVTSPARIGGTTGSIPTTAMIGDAFKSPSTS
jgi:hypothetical protein